MAEKVTVDLSASARLLHPRNVVLVSCVGKDGKANIITLAWSMPTSRKPPLVLISVAPGRHSHRLIQESGEFVVNIPTIDLAKEVLTCGRVSGREADKFKQAKLTPIPAQKVKAPLIGECVAHLECKLVQQVTTGDHTVFVGEVLAASASEGVFKDAFDAKRVKVVLHAGGDTFVTSTSKAVTPHI